MRTSAQEVALFILSRPLNACGTFLLNFFMAISFGAGNDSKRQRLGCVCARACVVGREEE